VTFGHVGPGKTPSDAVTFDHAGPHGWRITDVAVPAGAPFTAAAEEAYRKDGGVGYRVKVTLKKDAPPGIFQETIHLKTNDPTAVRLPLLVHGSVLRENNFISLRLGEVKPGKTLIRRVAFPGTGPFKVVGIDGHVRVTLAAKQLAQARTVTLQIDTPEEEGPFRYESLIMADESEVAAVVVIEGDVTGK